MSGVSRVLKPCGRLLLSGPTFADTSHLQVFGHPQVAALAAAADGPAEVARFLALVVLVLVRDRMKSS